VDQFAVEHRVLDDLHGSTVMMSMPSRLLSRAAVASRLARNIAALARSTFPSQLRLHRDPQDLR
jgi:hypothetical protein